MMKKSPYDNSNFLSKLFFIDAKPFLSNSGVKYSPPNDLGIEALTSSIIKDWSYEINKINPKIFKSLLRVSYKELIFINVPLAIEFLCYIVLSFSIGKLAGFYYNNIGTGTGFLYSLIIVACLIVMRLSRNYALFKSDRLGIRLKYALMKILYQKLCKISHEVVNSSDISVTVSNLSRYFLDSFDYFTNIDYLFLAPIAWVIICIIIYTLVGYAGIIGLVVMLFTIPIQIKCNKLSGVYTAKIQKLTESKLRLIEDTFEGIKVIKANLWEKIFLNKILTKRARESVLNKKLMMVKAVHLSLRLFSQVFSSMITFSIIIRSGSLLSVEDLFFVINLFYLSDAYIATLLPVATELLISYYTGCDLFQQFLMQKDKLDIHKKLKKGEIQLRDIVSYWSEDHAESTSSFCLSHVSLQIKPGDMCVLYGPTGSGKTALLLSIIGEIHIQHGSVYRGGKVAYVQQDPWIYAGSIRENIVLGKEFVEELYLSALNFAQLTEDLKGLVKADMTFLGDKGTSLSGGQRARIALARAFYSKADIYIFDNPLGSLDLSMAKVILENMISRFLSGKTRILATYLTDFVKEWMKVIKIEHGTLKIIKGMENDLSLNDKKKTAMAPFNVYVYKTSKFQTLKVNIGIQNFIKYWQGAGVFYLIILLCLYVVSGFLNVMMVFYLTKWTTSSSDLEFYFNMVVGSSLGLLGTVFLRNVIILSRLLVCGNKIHNKAIKRLLKSTADFFESEKKNKLLKRFNSDFGVIDQQLPQLYCEILQLSFMLLSSCVTILISNPWVAFVFVFVIIALAFNLKNKAQSILNLFQRNNSSKVPIHSHVTSTAQGIFSIRSYKLLNYFQHTFSELNAECMTNFFNYFSALKYVNITNELILTCMVLSHTFLSVSIKSELNPALLSTSLSFIINIFFTTAYLFALTIRLLSCMTSVSYMVQCGKLPKELDLSDKELEVSKGAISFSEIEFIYENGNIGLMNVSFEIKGGSRQGVIGKSGSGKSTLINCLLRLYDIREGKIVIDGTDISNVSLASLRKNICIVPQTPLIFEESIRFNIDPEGKYEDNEIWLVLRLVEMDVKVMALIGSLDAVISTSSLSIGEKQMISLARSMIKRCKILILDEVMSNIDYSEEIRLYDSIDSMNCGCTVVIITHRIDSLISCDNLIMLENGQCIETGNPKELLLNKESRFHKMAKMSEGGISSLRNNGIVKFMNSN